MNTSIWFYCIIGILIGDFLLATFINFLNAQRFKNKIPEEVADVYNIADYKKSQAYKSDNYRFGMLSSSFSLLLLLAMLYFGGFGAVDAFVSQYTTHLTLKALLFFGIILLGSDLLTTPFAYYQTFVIEAKYGFNNTNLTTFILDKIKGWGMLIVVGGAVLSFILWFFSWAGSDFWWYTWSVMTALTLFMNLFYSKLIVPIFNKQILLEEGELRTAIERYANKVGFDLQHIFVINGSKRSTKANAYFSGFGKEKRITLYDTLIKDLEKEEIVAVLAHEVGHYKKRHILFNLISSIALTGFMLFLLSLFINDPNLSLAIGVHSPSFHAALIAFGILYSPISELTALLQNFVSRKFEYQADNYAKQTYQPEPLISALKKLSHSSLSNLTPHPAYVFLYYSHPPLHHRIRNLKT